MRSHRTRPLTDLVLDWKEGRWACDPAARRGLCSRAGGADCFHCQHRTNGLFTDEQFHNNGLNSEPFPDLGRGAITNDAFDNGKVQGADAAQHHAHCAIHARWSLYHHRIRYWTTTTMAVTPAALYRSFMKFSDPDLIAELTAQKRARIIAFRNARTDMDFVNNPAFSHPGAHPNR